MNDAVKQPATRRLTCRSASLILGALSIVFPAAYFTMQSRAFAQWAATQDGPVCGMPMLAVLFLSVALMFVLALIAALLALVSYRRLPRPRPLRRRAELILLLLPMAASLAWLLLFMM
jgi:amino acid transporter